MKNKNFGVSIVLGSWTVIIFLGVMGIHIETASWIWTAFCTGLGLRELFN